jgi:hypothetical protein
VNGTLTIYGEKKTDLKEARYVGVDRARLIWLKSGKFMDILSFGFHKIISFNSENLATFCDSYSNSRIASSDKNAADYPDFNIVAICNNQWDTALRSGCRPYRVLSALSVR